MDPELTIKLVTAAREAGMSVSGLLRELTIRMEVDEAGKPLWAGQDEGTLFGQEARAAS